MDISDSRQLAKEMTSFCKQSVEERNERPRRDNAVRVALRGVIASLLGTATASIYPNRDTAWE